jgi:hypothetical protein
MAADISSEKYGNDQISRNDTNINISLMNEQRTDVFQRMLRTVQFGIFHLAVKGKAIPVTGREGP